MANEEGYKRGLSGASRGASESFLTKQERQPVLILHVDVDNIMISSFRFAREAVNAEKGELVDISAKQLASHILAETLWGTIDPQTGEWKAALGEEAPLREDERVTFGEYLRLHYKHSARQTADASFILLECLPLSSFSIAVDALQQRIHNFGGDSKVKRRAGQRSRSSVAVDAEAAAAAVRDGRKAILRRMMLPPTVCLALGCELPDTNMIFSSGSLAAAAPEQSPETGEEQPLQEGKGSEEDLEKSGQLPQQLQAGFWRLSPSFLSLVFSLARARRAFRLVLHTRHPEESLETQSLLHEFNLLCEGRHPAFDGENKTKQVLLAWPHFTFQRAKHALKAIEGNPRTSSCVRAPQTSACEGSSQVFLNGSRGSPNLTISKAAVGRLQVPRSCISNRNQSEPLTSEALPKLVFLESRRCYTGPQEIYAGLMYQELEESRAVCISHESADWDFLCGNSIASAEERQCADARKAYAAFQAQEAGDPEPQESLKNNEERFYARPHATSPLVMWVDAQDLTHFHVCLSSPGILTLVDGVTFIPSLLPIDVETRRPVALESGERSEGEEAGKAKSQVLPSLQTDVSAVGRLEFGATVSRISPTQWDCLTNSDCLVAALNLCERYRLQLATAFNARGGDQPAACSSRKDPSASRETEFGLSEPQASAGYPTGKKDNTASPAASDVDYLMKAVVPVLYPALEEVLRDRPEDPRAALAFYLLRNAGGYSRSSTRQVDGVDPALNCLL
ncbi:hypothetical protein Efla_006965 [Eimeria flavescens]